jgi:cytochrome c553
LNFARTGEVPLPANEGLFSNLEKQKMKRMNLSFLKLMLGAGLGLALAAGPALADDPDLDRLLASQCAQCHGTDGDAVGDIDSLAGEDFNELVEEMLEMKADDDLDDIMHRQARGYSDEQIRRIAVYFASLPPLDDDEEEEEDD